MIDHDDLIFKVSTGIERLDTYIPNWRDLVDINLLSMGEPQRDLPSQIFGSWRDAAIALDIFTGSDIMPFYGPFIDWGLCSAADWGSEEWGPENVALTDLWRRAVEGLILEGDCPTPAPAYADESFLLPLASVNRCLHETAKMLDGAESILPLGDEWYHFSPTGSLSESLLDVGRRNCPEMVP